MRVYLTIVLVAVCAVGKLPSSLVFPIIAGCVYEPDALGIGSVIGVSNLGVASVPVG